MYGVSQFIKPLGRVDRVRAAHLAKRHAAMRRAGLFIPLTLSRSDARPHDPRRQPRPAGGVAPLGHVRELLARGDGTLSAVLELPDDRAGYVEGQGAAAAVQRGFTELSGRTWPGESLVTIALLPDAPPAVASDPWTRFSLAGGADCGWGTGRTTWLVDRSSPPATFLPPGRQTITRFGSATGLRTVDLAGQGNGRADPSDRLKRVLDLLADQGILLPQDTRQDSLAERLCVALLALEGAEGYNRQRYLDQVARGGSAAGRRGYPANAAPSVPMGGDYLGTAVRLLAARGIKLPDDVAENRLAEQLTVVLQALEGACVAGRKRERERLDRMFADAVEENASHM